MPIIIVIIMAKAGFKIVVYYAHTQTEIQRERFCFFWIYQGLVDFFNVDPLSISIFCFLVSFIFDIYFLLKKKRGMGDEEDEKKRRT